MREQGIAAGSIWGHSTLAATVSGRTPHPPKASATARGIIWPGTKRWCTAHQDWECRRHAEEHNR